MGNFQSCRVSQLELEKHVNYLKKQNERLQDKLEKIENNTESIQIHKDLQSFILKNDDEQITIDHLIDLMEQKLANTAHKAYGYTHMKKRLQEHFGEKIILTEINGKSNVATFKTTARAMLHEYYKQQQQGKKHN